MNVLRGEVSITQKTPVNTGVFLVLPLTKGYFCDTLCAHLDAVRKWSLPFSCRSFDFPPPRPSSPPRIPQWCSSTIDSSFLRARGVPGYNPLSSGHRLAWGQPPQLSLRRTLAFLRSARPSILKDKGGFVFDKVFPCLFCFATLWSYETWIT